MYIQRTATLNTFINHRYRIKHRQAISKTEYARHLCTLMIAAHLINADIHQYADLPAHPMTNQSSVRERLIAGC